MSSVAHSSHRVARCRLKTVSSYRTSVESILEPVSLTAKKNYAGPLTSALSAHTVYVNNVQCGMTNYMKLFTDDAKLMKVVKNRDDCRELQGDIDNIDEWSKRWN